MSEKVGKPLTPDEAASMKPYERQQGGWWEYGSDPHGTDKVWRALTQWDPRTALTPTVVHVHHDTEAHARSFNEGYEAAVSQGLADDPMLASEWLEGKLREAKAEALEEAARAFEISPHNSRAKMARHFNNAYVAKLRARAADERADS